MLLYLNLKEEKENMHDASGRTRPRVWLRSPHAMRDSMETRHRVRREGHLGTHRTEANETGSLFSLPFREGNGKVGGGRVGDARPRVVLN